MTRNRKNGRWKNKRENALIESADKIKNNIFSHTHCHRRTHVFLSLSLRASVCIWLLSGVVTSNWMRKCWHDHDSDHAHHRQPTDFSFFFRFLSFYSPTFNMRYVTAGSDFTLNLNLFIDCSATTQWNEVSVNLNFISLWFSSFFLRQRWIFHCLFDGATNKI